MVVEARGLVLLLSPVWVGLPCELVIVRRDVACAPGISDMFQQLANLTDLVNHLFSNQVPPTSEFFS